MTQNNETLTELLQFEEYVQSEPILTKKNNFIKKYK